MASRTCSASVSEDEIFAINGVDLPTKNKKAAKFDFSVFTGLQQNRESKCI